MEDNNSNLDVRPNDSTTRWYLNLASKAPLLDRQGEIVLARRIMNGDDDAYQKLVVSNTLLVVTIAKSYPTSVTLELNDLIGAGNMGLMIAARKYDPESFKGVKFSSYAAFLIRQSILITLSKYSRTIRIPTHRGQNSRKLRKISERLSHELGRDPTVEELSEAIGFDQNTINDLLSEIKLFSLDSTFTPDGDEFSNVVADDSIVSPDEHCICSDFKDTILSFVENLDERQKVIITQRFGLDGSGEKTLEEVGAMFGLTRERIRQIEANALQKLGELTGIRKRGAEVEKKPRRKRRRGKR